MRTRTINTPRRPSPEAYHIIPDYERNLMLIMFGGIAAAIIIWAAVGWLGAMNQEAYAKCTASTEVCEFTLR